MVVRRVAAAASLIALLVAPAARADVSDYLGKPVAVVTIQSEGRTLTDPRLIALIETRAGQPLGMREVRESIAHLFSLAQYEDVRARASLSGSGVALVYELVPLHPVERIGFAGGNAAG